MKSNDALDAKNGVEDCSEKKRRTRRAFLFEAASTAAFSTLFSSLSLRNVFRESSVFGADDVSSTDWFQTSWEFSADSVAIPPEAKTAIEAGLDALAARQNSNGSFGAESELFGRDPGVAALCGLAFLASGSSPGRGRFGRQLDKIVDYILSKSVKADSLSNDASKSFSNENSTDKNATFHYLQENDLTPVDVDGLIVDFCEKGRKPLYGHGYSTFFLAEILGSTPRPEIRDRLRAAVDLIIRTQNGEGGWRYEPKRVAVADISVTACQLSALRAARNAGLFVPPETISRALAFVERCQNSDGGFRYMSVDGPSGFARTAAALQALQAGGADDSEAVEKGFRYLETAVPLAADNFSKKNNADVFSQEKRSNGVGDVGGANDAVPRLAATRIEYYFYGEFYASICYWRAARDADSSERWARWARRAYPNLLSRRRDDGLWNSTVSVDAETAFALCAMLVPREGTPFFLR